MLHYRQKQLLTLLDALGGEVSNVDFQKLLFLYCMESSAPSYRFVPYKYGSFSFTSYADKRQLINAGYLDKDEKAWRLTRAGRLAIRHDSVEPLRALAFSDKYSNLRGKRLIAVTYRRFPYYAIRSEILSKLSLAPKVLHQIVASRPPQKEPGLLTIGYEGRALEEYLNELLLAGVTLLCDVRQNPISRKYGFSKGTLGNACMGVGIRYEHIPELGIASEQRQGLHTQEDYDTLFREYENDYFPRKRIRCKRSITG